MKHLNEDELLMSVFDDSDSLNLDDLDQEQKREFMALSGLKLDLKRLNDIPPCQLSSDRLRRRILEEGIQGQKQGRTGWFWFASAGAVSCACMAAAAVMIWNWYQPAPLQQNLPLAMAVPDTARIEPEKVIETKPVPEVASEEANGDSVVAPAEPSRPSRTQRRPYQRPPSARSTGSVMIVAKADIGSGMITRSSEPKEDPGAGSVLGGMDAAAMTSAVDSQPAPGAPASSTVVSQPMGKSSPVVVISQSPNPQSPAVESSGHVVFGG